MPEIPIDKQAAYSQIIEKVFERSFEPDRKIHPFTLKDLEIARVDLGLNAIGNMPDVLYSFRYRTEFPDAVKQMAPVGMDWIIVGAGKGKYVFRLAAPAKLSPSTNRQLIKIPENTPEIVKMYAPGTDEQAILARVRYNRLIDLFLGLTCYSIQNHLRTTVPKMGQIEIDEFYVGVSKGGAHYVIPCQAKSKDDKFGIVQVKQDWDFCRKVYPYAVCRPIAMKFLNDTDVAVVELAFKEYDEVYYMTVVDERHYQLCAKDALSSQDILHYASREPL